MSIKNIWIHTDNFVLDTEASMKAQGNVHWVTLILRDLKDRPVYYIREQFVNYRKVAQWTIREWTLDEKIQRLKNKIDKL